MYLEILNGVEMTGKFDVAHFEWCRTLGEGSFATVLLARLKTNFGSNAAGKEFAIKKVIFYIIQGAKFVANRTRIFKKVLY